MSNRIISRLSYILSWHIYFFRFSVRQFYLHRGLQIASSLSYTTLLSLVPLITVMFGFLGGLPFFEDAGLAVQIFIYENFIPSFGDALWEYLNSFASKASQLTVTGICILLIIAILLMSTIDNALNTIWHIRNRRNPIARFLVYWATLTLGPLLVGVGLVSTSYLLSLPVISEVDATFGFEIKKNLLSSLPFLTTSIAFSLLYILIPNCFVLRKHAFIGGFAAAILFELAKYGFGIYVKTMTSYQTIYGAIAIIPLFLIWIYLSWVIVILGAHFTFCMSAFRYDAEKSGRMNPDWEFIDVVSLLFALWQVQKDGKPLQAQHLSRYGIRLPQYQINEIMGCLQQANWVYQSSGGNWMLSRNLSDVTILDLSEIIPRKLPSRDENRKDSWAEDLFAIIERNQANMNTVLSVPIAGLFTENTENSSD